MPLPSRQTGVLGGRYRLDEPIGRGGTSVVWRAHDELLDRDVAVKILGDGGERFRRRLRAEATAVARLRNPHIAHMYDYGEVEADDGTTTPYLVMELVAGIPLSSLLADGGAVEWRKAVDIGAQVATALAVAHKDGLVHRDVKPENVLLTPDGVKLIDFGISAAVGSDDAETDGGLLGTVAYVAPERLAGAPVGPAADVYALGVMLHRMIAGVLPWSAVDRIELLSAHLNVDPQPLPLAGGVPPALAEICAQCLVKDSSRRPTATELASRLPRLAGRTAAIAVSEPTAELPPVVATGHRWARRIVAVAAVAVICLVALIIGWASRGGRTNAAAGGVPTTGVPCVASFSVQDGRGGRFNATLTVINTGSAVHGWRIAFAFPGGQRLATGGSALVPVVAGDHSRYTASLRQVGATVTASNSQQTLAPKDSVTLPITGRYTATNPIPVEFRLNDRPCVAPSGGATGGPTPRAGTPGAGGSGAPSTTGSPTGGANTGPSPTGPATGTTAPATPPPGTTAPGTTPPATATPTGPPTPPPPSATGGGSGQDGQSEPLPSPTPHHD